MSMQLRVITSVWICEMILGGIVGTLEFGQSVHRILHLFLCTLAHFGALLLGNLRPDQRFLFGCFHTPHDDRRLWSNGIQGSNQFDVIVCNATMTWTLTMRCEWLQWLERWVCKCHFVYQRINKQLTHLSLVYEFKMRFEKVSGFHYDRHTIE